MTAADMTRADLIEALRLSDEALRVALLALRTLALPGAAERAQHELEYRRQLAISGGRRLGSW